MVSSLHVLGSCQLGGAERFYVRLIEALNQAGHPCLAVIRRDSPVASQLSNAVERVYLPFASKWDFYTRWRLTQLVAARRPDIVQTYMGRATRLTRLPSGSEARHVARLGGYYKVDGYYRHAHAWVGNTRDICDFMRAKGLPSDRVFHIGNFVPAPRAVPASERADWRRSLGLSEQDFVVFTLGRLVAKKGFVDLLEAFALLPATLGGRPLALVVAGDGAERARLADAANRLGIAARVRWAGWQDDPTPYYALADVFVCPSRHEPLGNVILEAWRHRLPVLTTRNEGARELVTEDHNALLAPVSDPPKLALALQRLIVMPATDRQRMADAGLATVQHGHAPEAVVAAYLALYERLMQEPSAPGPHGETRKAHRPLTPNAWSEGGALQPGDSAGERACRR